MVIPTTPKSQLLLRIRRRLPSLVPSALMPLRGCLLDYVMPILLVEDA